MCGGGWEKEKKEKNKKGVQSGRLREGRGERRKRGKE